MDVPLWAWAAVSALIVGVLLADLLVFHRHAHEVSMREAAWSSALWVALGVTHTEAVAEGPAHPGPA